MWWSRRRRSRCCARSCSRSRFELGNWICAYRAAHIAYPLHNSLLACCRLCDHFPGVPIVIRLGNRFCLRYTALRTLPLLDADLHAGRLRRGEPRTEFVVRLGNRFCLRHTALCTLPLLDAVCHAGGLRCSKPCAEFVIRLGNRFCLRRTALCTLPLLNAFLCAGDLRCGKPRAEAVPLGGRRGGPPIRAAVVADNFGIARSGAGSEYSLPDDPEVTRGRFCGAPLARRAIPAVGVVFSCRGAGRLFCIVLIPAVARCRHELWIPLVACTAIGSLLAGFCAGGLFNDLPRPEFVGHDVADGKDAAPPADGTFQFVVSSLQAGWLFLIGLYNVFMVFRIIVVRRARKRGNRGQRRHERKYQEY